ncbi:hypothetical protein HYH03_013696 [Edaphochlamys debaryana]|uniref:Small ribosomal subunit protein uS15c n=1 Tax=Edaphochlamys debaryana TaxID=47281 RepID=A0A835XMQ1_9CHLO|nr:hypothetical protein HYH03_013696 [Edaphochlamys debaryana]|eukprot:KAG2487697.1 hypothetical protein HYH03_013696 [Edaphochlamys debaryana]
MASRLLGRVVSTIVGSATGEAPLAVALARQGCCSTQQGVVASTTGALGWRQAWWCRGQQGLSTSASPSSAAQASVATASSVAHASTASSTGAGRSEGGDGGDARGPAPAALPDPKPDLVDAFLSVDMLSLPLQRRVARQGVARDFQRHPADTGSPQVMVAMWTERIRDLVRHFDSNRKQLHSMRQLELMSNQRRRMLIWLRRADFEAYSYTIQKLGLKDIYTPTGFSDRYREGLRPSDPVDDAVNRWRFNFHTKYKQRKTSLWGRLRPKLIAEDPSLEAADSAAAAEDKARQRQQRAASSQRAQQPL